MQVSPLKLSCYMQWQIQRGIQGCTGTLPLAWAAPSTKNDKPNGTPLSDYRTKKTAAMIWLTSECFRRKFVRKQINWTGRAGSLSQKQLKWAWFCSKVGGAFKNFTHMKCIPEPPF